MKLDIVDEEAILGMLTIQIDMGINVVIRDNILDVKEEIISNAKKKIFENTLITNPEKKAYDVALQAIDISSLEKLFRNFDGCHLKKTASNFVAYEGNIKGIYPGY